MVHILVEGVYDVIVKTSEDSYPPNSCTATITVYGEEGRSKEMELSLDASADAFQPGNTDKFEVRKVYGKKL